MNPGSPDEAPVMSAGIAKRHVPSPNTPTGQGFNQFTLNSGHSELFCGGRLQGGGSQRPLSAENTFPQKQSNLRPLPGLTTANMDRDIGYRRKKYRQRKKGRKIIEKEQTENNKKQNKNKVKRERERER